MIGSELRKWGSTKLWVITVIVVISSCSNDLTKPYGLLCELLRAPGQAVITDPQPEFSWIVPTAAGHQQAYQILVASDERSLTESEANAWNSGKKISDQSINISYEGETLKPNSTYWWKVKVWNEDGSPSDYSDPQKFHTGKFIRNSVAWEGKSPWVQLPDSNWVAEDRQKASFEVRKAKDIVQHSSSQWFVDFGKAAFGTLELTISADVDQEVTILMGEHKNEDNTVYTDTGISNIALHEHELSLKEGEHTYLVEVPRHIGRYPHSQALPAFYHEVLPFRYVEINSDHGIELKDIKQLALYYYFDDEASAFTSSDTSLNKVWDLCKYTLKATPFLGVYCDGNRERMPYEADAYIQQLGHYAVDREYSVARYTTLFLLSHASWPTEWQMHTVMMAREHFMHTGDTELISEYYDELKAKTLLELAREDGLISTRTGKVTPEFLNKINYGGESIKDIVDWPRGTPEGEEQIPMAGPTPEGERDGYVFTDYNTVVNAFHYYALKCMEEFARALNKEEDGKYFDQQAQIVRSSIIDHFFDMDQGVFTDGIDTDHASLHANMFPVAFGIIPDGYEQSVIQHIKSRGMACSVYGAQYLLEALYNLGEAEYALELMTSGGKRSWLNMINVGSTMTTEAWDEYYKPNLTWNHAWGSAPANIIPRRMMGIQPVTPGFKTFKVEPQINGLKSIKLQTPTIRGNINCEVNSQDNKWQMKISVPGNTEAIFYAPEGLKNVKVEGTGKYAAELQDASRSVTLQSGDFVISGLLSYP